MTQDKNILASIKKIIKGSTTFFVAGHLNPDGDTIGTALALASVLRRLGKKVKVYYDPKKPNNAILERGILPFVFSMMFITAISLFFMGWLAIPSMINVILTL